MQMTVFADNLGLMQERYGFKISLQNIWQYRIIDATGKVSGFNLDEKSIEQVIGKAPTEQKYTTMNLDAKFVPVLDLLEFGQYPIAMKQVTTFKKTAKKNDLLAVNSIHDAVKKDADAWAEEASAAKESDPLKAHDLYARIAASLPGENLGKSATTAMKKLETNKSVKAEMGARTAYQRVLDLMAKAQALPTTRPAAAHALAEVARKYADTPTAVKAQAARRRAGRRPDPAEEEVKFVRDG